jgi:hypothetical protein
MLQYLRGMRGHGRGGRRVQQSERQTRNQEHGRVYHHFLARAMGDLLPSSSLAVVIVKRDENVRSAAGVTRSRDTMSLVANTHSPFHVCQTARRRPWKPHSPANTPQASSFPEHACFCPVHIFVQCWATCPGFALYPPWCYSFSGQRRIFCRDQDRHRWKAA